MVQTTVFAVSLAILPVAGGAAPGGAAPVAMTEVQAVQEALARHASLARRRAEVEQAEGRLVAARTYPYNPEIEAQAARRESDDTSYTDRGLVLTQELEISGARGRRIEQATAELEAAQAILLHESRWVAARVSAAFTDALRARDGLAVERANVDLVATMADAARKAMELGAGTQVQTNVALSQLGRARREFHLAEARYAVARAVLAQAIGMGPPEGPIPEGPLEVEPAAPVPLPEMLEAIGTRRADLLALRSEVRAAQARTEAARRDAFPHLVLSAFREREGVDTVTGGSLTVGIPIFNRNQGAVREAFAGERRAEAELRATESEVMRAGVESIATLLAAQRSANELRSDVVGQLEDSLRLLLRSYEAGKIGFPEVVAFRRELVEAQREYIDALASARLARIELDLVMAKDAVPTNGAGK